MIISWSIGALSNRAPRPIPREITMTGKPKQIPKTWGILCLIPKLTPDAIIIILFGPGVILAVAVNNSIAK